MRSSVGQCELDDQADVCTQPSQAITASSTEAGAPDVHADVTYAITSANKHNYVVFTATTSGTHTLYYGDSEPVRVCHEDTLYASTLDAYNNLKHITQYTFIKNKPNIIKINTT